MPNQDVIDQQQQLLNTYRRTLNHYLSQQAAFSKAYTPPAIVFGIEEARNHIQQIKIILRSLGVVVEDHPDDISSPNVGSKSVSGGISQTLAQLASNHLSAEARFWLWFEMNSERIMNFKSGHDLILKELHNELHRVTEGLTFEFSSKNEYGREFIISADGIIDRFSSVIHLVGIAPDLPGWKFIAFRQPKDTQFLLSIGRNRLSADDIWFSLEPNGIKLDIMLYIRRYSKRNQEFIQGASLLALDAALGEYDVETKIGYIELREAPKDPRVDGLQAFHNLPNIIKSWRPKIS